MAQGLRLPVLDRLVSSSSYAIGKGVARGAVCCRPAQKGGFLKEPPRSAFFLSRIMRGEGSELRDEGGFDQRNPSTGCGT